MGASQVTLVTGTLVIRWTIMASTLHAVTVAETPGIKEGTRLSTMAGFCMIAIDLGEIMTIKAAETHGQHLGIIISARTRETFGMDLQIGGISTLSSSNSNRTMICGSTTHMSSTTQAGTVLLTGLHIRVVAKGAETISCPRTTSNSKVWMAELEDPLRWMTGFARCCPMEDLRVRPALTVTAVEDLQLIMTSPHTIQTAR